MQTQPNSVEMPQVDVKSKEDAVSAEKLYDLMKRRTAQSVIGGNAGDEPKDNSIAKDAAAGRRIYVLRHGERIDFTFGTWVPYCFDQTGNYIRKDLNMPKSLPQRLVRIECDCLLSVSHVFGDFFCRISAQWKRDSPLTNMGLYQARLTGEGMKDAGVRIDHVYSSPSFRCIQTTTSILEGLGLKDSHPIHVEPGLFEWLAWYQEGLPDWLSKEELVAAEYNIVLDYEPLTKEDDLKARLQEGLEEFYHRNSSVTEHLINNTSKHYNAFKKFV